MDKKFFRQCGCCRGKGLVEITGAYAETLKLLTELPTMTEPSGADLARMAGVRMEAMANRLVALEKMGIVTSRTYGRKRLWRLK